MTSSRVHVASSPRSRQRLLVVLPALNEEQTIERVIRAIPRQIEGVRSVDVLVVNDGSADRTARIAEGAAAHVVHHPHPAGVGAAFQTALSYGIDHGADLIVTIDADGQFDPALIPRLIEPVRSGEADFATASRFKDPSLVPRMPWIKKWGNRMMSRLVSRLAGQRIYDVSCGMRCYSRSAALKIYAFARFTYTQEVILNLAYHHLRIAEVPLEVRGEREHGKSRVANNLWHYGVRTVRIIFSCYRDYYPLRFFGGLAAMLFAGGATLGAFLLWHRFSSGQFTPHKWAGFASALLVALSLMTFHIGIIGDMLNRHRIYLEEALYRLRRTASPDEEDAGARESPPAGSSAAPALGGAAAGRGGG